MSRWRKAWPFLTFDPVTHEYRVNGARVKSVTQILGDAGLYPPINGAAEKAMQRGRAVHAATQYLDEGTLDHGTVDERIVPFLDAYEKFKRECDFRPILIEQPCYHGSLGFAGTIDRVAVVNGRFGILDIKTGSVGPTTGAQLSGYDLLYEEAKKLDAWADVRNDSAVLWSLLLTADGKYKLTRHGDDTGLFMAALTISRFKEEHHGAS